MACEHGQTQSCRTAFADPGHVLVPADDEPRRQEGICTVSHPRCVVFRHRRVRGQDVKVWSYAPRRQVFRRLRWEFGDWKWQPCGCLRRQWLRGIYLHEGLVDVSVFLATLKCRCWTGGLGTGSERATQSQGLTPGPNRPASPPLRATPPGRSHSRTSRITLQLRSFRWWMWGPMPGSKERNQNQEKVNLD